MTCKCFNNCDTCTNYDDCLYNHKSDGSPFCYGFVCNVDECKRSFCFTRTEVLSDPDCDDDVDNWDDEIYED